MTTMRTVKMTMRMKKMTMPKQQMNTINYVYVTVVMMKERLQTECLIQSVHNLSRLRR